MTKLRAGRPISRGPVSSEHLYQPTQPYIEINTGDTFLRRVGGGPASGGQGVKLTTDAHVMSSLRIYGDIPPLIHICLPGIQRGSSFFFTCVLTNKIQCDSFGTRSKKMRMPQSLFIRF